MDRAAARRMLGVIFVSAGLAHLAKRRFFDSLVPDWLAPMRREIDVVTGSLEVVGGIVMLLPRLRRTGRLVNLTLRFVMLTAAVDNLRHPDRIHRERPPLPGMAPLVAALRIPPQIGAAAVVWWATEAD